MNRHPQITRYMQGLRGTIFGFRTYHREETHKLTPSVYRDTALEMQILAMRK